MTSFTVRPPLAVLAVAVLAAVSLWRSSPSPPKGTEAPASRFSAARAEEVLRRLVGDGAPRVPGTPGHAAFRERLGAELRGLGLSPITESGLACAPHGSCAFLTNVLAELPGTGPGPVVLLVAHHDGVGAGPAVADDAASVAILLEAARALLLAPRRNPVLLLFDDGEESGLLGAELFVRSDRARSVGVVVNLEARGTTGASFLFETGRDNAWLVRRAVTAMPRPVTSSVFSYVYDRLPNDTDLTVFKREGVPGLNLAFIGSPARYHTREDSLANLSQASLQHQGENALALARALADADLVAPPPGDAVFFDLAGLLVLWWPKEASPALALLALALVRAASVRRGGRFLCRPGALVPFLAPLAGALAGAALWQVLRLSGAFPIHFVAHGWASTLAVAAVALAVALPVLAAETRRTGTVESSWERVWTSTALVGLALAALAPEISFLLVLPALVAGAARLVLPEAVSPWIAAGLLGLLLLPLALRMPEALGPTGLPIVALAVGFVLPALPLEVAPGAWRRSPAVLAAIAAAATVAALLLPSATPDRPEGGSMLAVAHEGEPGARLVYQPASRRLHREVASAAPFERRSDALRFPRPQAGFVTPLPSLGEPFPALDVLSNERQPDGSRRLVIRLVSRRGAPAVGLVAPEGVVPGSVRVEGQALARPYLRRPFRRTGPTRVFCRAVPPEGLLVELQVTGERVEATVIDQSPGLPPAAGAIGSRRPASVSPVDGGDVTLLSRSVFL